MSDLKAELMEIRGIGEATADEILEVIENRENPHIPDDYKERVSGGSDIDRERLDKYLRQHRIQEARALISE